MPTEGPPLEHLVRRLAETPPDFLETPKTKKETGVHVDAVVADLVVDLGGETPTAADLAAFIGCKKSDIPRLRLTLTACHLLHDEWFRTERRFADAAFDWLREDMGGLADLVAPELFVEDSDRREELVRLCLRALDLRPQGETEAVAEDRLRTLDSVERERLVRETRKKQERARKLREKMERERAREAAAKASREW